jgi:hypothetical protein
MVRVCCFCDMVHDEAIGLWRERRNAGIPGEAAILSYTCCLDCFEVDPRASVFRARRNEPKGSPDLNGVRSPRSKWSRAAA